MPDDTLESEPETVLLEIPTGDWEMILDYIYGNLEWDSDSDETETMRAAMNRIRNAHYFYHIERKSEHGIE